MDGTDGLQANMGCFNVMSCCVRFNLVHFCLLAYLVLCSHNFNRVPYGHLYITLTLTTSLTMAGESLVCHNIGNYLTNATAQCYITLQFQWRTSHEPLCNVTFTLAFARSVSNNCQQTHRLHFVCICLSMHNRSTYHIITVNGTAIYY